MKIGDETQIAHLIFGTLDVSIIDKKSDDKGDYWIGRVIDNESMFNEPVKFRKEDIVK